MRYANLIKNDVVNGNGVCVSLFMQGCHFHCRGCHNQSTWDFNSGIEIDREELGRQLITALSLNGVHRNFSLLGGEPLCKENIADAAYLIQKIKQAYPSIKIFVWTGYELNELRDAYKGAESDLNIILSNINYLITGRYIEAQRDITLKWRGSRNQHILEKGIYF